MIFFEQKTYCNVYNYTLREKKEKRTSYNLSKRMDDLILYEFHMLIPTYRMYELDSLLKAMYKAFSILLMLFHT